MALTIALAGDTMLGRMVGEALGKVQPESLVATAVVEAAGRADRFFLNLECCISTRGSPWPEPGKPFFFRAPPAAVETLNHLGVSCVTLANNHALDFGYEALVDTFEHLSAAGIEWVGAGPDIDRARAVVRLDTGGLEVSVLALTDHPASFAATSDRPGVAYADLRLGVPAWVTDAVRSTAGALLLSPHWGPNMTPGPVPHVSKAARVLVEAGATVVAGHSAHVFHGVSGRVLYDLGDFLDDYAVDPELRNDLGLLWLVTMDGEGPRRLEALPLKLEYCRTELAQGDDADWIRRRFRSACAALGTEVKEESGFLVVELG
jgi:poly-gamma-glutamate capsule biosynthesis protein CapA/YwtB (metallophosphatase superfamily)